MKTIKIILITSMLLILSGCNNTNEEITLCNYKNTNADANYNLKSEYKIYSTDKIVNKVIIKETVISNSSVILDYFESYLSNLYKTNNNIYGGYDNKIVKTDDELISTTTIDYNQMDLEKYINDNPAINNYLNHNNKITLDGVINIYKTIGATCS